eukprot:COSAG01_NODE_23546_length_811_cov_1.063202_1_plen_93_part_10
MGVQPRAFAGKLRPRRLNNWPFGLTFWCSVAGSCDAVNAHQLAGVAHGTGAGGDNGVAGEKCRHVVESQPVPITNEPMISFGTPACLEGGGGG